MTRQRTDRVPPGQHRGGLRASFRYAFAGLWWTLRTQRNMRIHLALGIAAGLLGIVVGLSSGEFAVLALTIAVVMAAEMLNTVVEAAIDLASPEYHPLAKIAKDVAAGAVLLTAMGAVAVGLFLFLPHL